MSTENKKNIVKMATIYAQEGKWDKAISEYKKLITLDPTDYNVHNMLGDAYSKKSDDALSYQEYVVAAEAYIKQGLPDKAAIIYKKIGRLDSEKLPEKERQKQILIKKHTTAEKFIEGGEIDKAIETYKEIIKLSPANFEIHQKLGELYAEKGDKVSAQEYYRKIVDVYFKNRLYKRALPIYQKILEMEPEDISAREKIAEIYEREANESDAKREYLFLAEHYWKEKNIEKTDFFAQKAVEFKSIEAHFFKGAALYDKKEMGEAKKEFEMLLKFKANHTGALTLMACIYRDQGQMDEALAMFEKVIKSEPENFEAIEELAALYAKKGLNKEAVTKYMMAVNVLNSKQQYETAAAVLNKIAAIDPENIDALSKMGEAFVKLNKKKEAGDTYLRISDIYKKENLAEKAAEYYKMAQNVDPANEKIVDRAKKLASEPVSVKVPEPAKPAADKSKAAPPAPVAAAKQEQKPGGVEPPAFKIQHTSSSFGPKPAAAAQPHGPEPKPEKKPDVKPEGFKIQHNSAVFTAQKQAAPPARNKEEEMPENLPDIDIFGMGGKKPSEKIAEMERSSPAQKVHFVPQGMSDDDIPSMIAMADSYAKSGAFDEAIEMYQKALAMEPGNQNIKKKLNDVYSKYAGMPIAGAPDTEAKKKADEEAWKKADEEVKKKKEEDDRKKKAAEEAMKKAGEEAKMKADEEAKKKREEEDRKKKADEEIIKKAEEEAKNKKVEDDRKKKEEELKKKKEEEKKKKADDEEDLVNDEYSDDFVTVTTAEIFVKQGLFTEAEKILGKILKKDPANIEAKMKLDEMKKLQTETEQKGENVMDEEVKKGKSSKVTYI